MTYPQAPAPHGIISNRLQFYKLTGTKNGAVTYHAYSEFTRNDWRWSTPIVSISDSEFTTNSGSLYQYEASDLHEFTFSVEKLNMLADWFNAETILAVTLDEVVSAVHK